MLPLRLRNGAIGASKDSISVGAFWAAACDVLGSSRGKGVTTADTLVSYGAPP